MKKGYHGQDLAALFGLDRHTIKDIDNKALQKMQTERSLQRIEVLGMNEIAVERGITSGR